MGQKTKIEKLKRDSWDFSQCPKEELSFCVTYEYFRQIAMIHRKRIGKKWSLQVFEEVFNGYFKDRKRVEFKGIVDGQVADPFEINLSVKRMFALAACKCSGFPDVAYLGLTAKERSAWIKAYGLDKLRPDRPAMAQEDFFEIIRDPKEALQFYQYHCAEWVRQNLHTGSHSVKKNTPWIVDYDGYKFELGVIRINWSWSDKKLTNAFKKWLGKNRQGIKPNETRGSTTMAELLSFLSAWRLLRAMTAKDAGDFTQEMLGDSLYQDDVGWYKAQSEADSVMKQISTPFFDWL